MPCFNSNFVFFAKATVMLQSFVQLDMFVCCPVHKVCPWRVSTPDSLVLWLICQVTCSKCSDLTLLCRAHGADFLYDEMRFVSAIGQLMAERVHTSDLQHTLQ